MFLTVYVMDYTVLKLKGLCHELCFVNYHL